MAKGTPRALLVALLLTAALPGSALGHGINGHVWATDRAVGRLLEGQGGCELAAFFADPAVRAAVQIGPAFPDSGYAIEHPYGEAAHWPPFAEAFLAALRDEYGARYDGLDARRRLAFAMGAASHGIEDEIFDSLFMHRANEAEGSTQDLLDTYTDFMLVGQGHAELQPATYLPPGLVEVFADPRVGIDVGYGQFEHGMFVVRNVVIGLADIPKELPGGFPDLLPWTTEHYLDPETPGSIGYEPLPVARYLEALWHRAHGRFRMADVIVHSFPPPGERTPGLNAASVDSWITLVLGYGARVGDLDATSVRLVGPGGDLVPAAVHRTRWNDGNPRGWTRILQLRPLADLEPGAAYSVEVDAGIELIDGRRTPEPARWTVHSACAPGSLCPQPDGAGGAGRDGAGPAAAGTCANVAPDGGDGTGNTVAGGGCSAGSGESSGLGVLLLVLAAMALGRGRPVGLR